MVGLYVCAVLAVAGDPPAQAAIPTAILTPSGDQSAGDQSAGDQSAGDQSAGDQSAPRPMHEIHRDLRSALALEAEETEAPLWAATVARLCLIYGEIMRDPRLSDSPTLAGYRVKIRARLLGIQKGLERDMKRQGRAVASGSSRSKLSPALGNEPWSLGLSLGGESSDQLAARLKQETHRWTGAGGGAARGDYGPLLVELIRQTIAPEFWDVHGGPGVILYYRPGHALVVRATGDIHGRIGGPVDALRN